MMFALCLLAAGFASAQDAVTSMLDIEVQGVDCSRLTGKLFLVRDGVDGYPIELKPGAVCHWNLTLPSFDTKISYFSLRLGLARTQCHKAKAVRKGPGVWVAELKFKCCIAGTVETVTVRMKPEDPISYVRKVLKEDVPGVFPAPPESRECLEMSVFSNGGGTIEQVQFEGEQIRLQLGERVPRPDGFGVIINPPRGQQKKRDEMTPDGVVWRMAVQRAKGLDRSAPNLSTSAIAVDIVKLSQLKLETLAVDVEK